MPRNYRQIKVDGRCRLLHRVIMERHIGRPLTDDETVHHVNGDTYDNQIENLQVMPRGAHVRLHKTGVYKRSKHDLLAVIRQVAETVGRRPRGRADFQRLTGLDQDLVAYAFGSWNRAVNMALGEAVGARQHGDAHNPTSAGRIDDKDLIADFLRVKRLLGKTPSKRQYTKHGRWTGQTLYHHYGSYANAVRQIEAVHC